jgi:hypothetical protein
MWLRVPLFVSQLDSFAYLHIVEPDWRVLFRGSRFVRPLWSLNRRWSVAWRWRVKRHIIQDSRNGEEFKWKDLASAVPADFCLYLMSSFLRVTTLTSATLFRNKTLSHSILYEGVSSSFEITFYLDFGETILVNGGYKTNSVAHSPLANYTDWPTATSRRNLVPTLADRGVSPAQRGGSPRSLISVF